MEFLNWLGSKECEQYWEKDEEGERVILRSGSDKAQAEFNRIKATDNKQYEK